MQQLPLETHRYHRYDLRLNAWESGGNTSLLFLEDDRGNVYLYRTG